MTNPYRMLEQWPHPGDIKSGAAIGIVPDGKGGVWLQHRSAPAIVHIDPLGNITRRFDVTFSSAHGMWRDRDGNFWASARDGSIRYFIEGTRPEGLGADELGNVFGGLTGGCNASPSGGCLQKFVRKIAAGAKRSPASGGAQ